MTPRSTNDRDYDVAIVGGGPAGASAAIRIASAGLKVAVIEKDTFPRAKLCGEFISPECLEHFEELGVNAEMRTLGAVPIRRTVFYSRSGRGVEFPNSWLHSANDAVGLSRAAMDHELLLRAARCGAEILCGWSARHLVVNGDVLTGLTVRDPTGEEHSIAADYVIDASGRGSKFAQSAETARRRDPRRPRQVAFKAHLTGAKIDNDTCEIYAYKAGYGGCSPIEDDSFNLCFIVDASSIARARNDPAEIMDRIVAENQRARRVLSGATVSSSWLSVPIRGFGRSDGPSVGGLLSAGDAAAFIDPFTGSGILMALESSRLLSEILIDGIRAGVPPGEVTDRYTEAHREHFRGRLRMAAALRTATISPRIASFLLRMLGSSRILRGVVARSTRR